MLSEKKYVCTCTGIVAFIVIVIAAFNYWQDPADIFAGERKYGAFAKEHCEGKTLVVASNYNERLFRKCVIANGENDYEAVILGSSRVMIIGENTIWNNQMKLINLGVSGGALEDDIALWYCYMKNMDTKPKKVIIGIDPWMLNRHNGEDRWQQHLANEYAAAVREMGFSCQIKENSEGYSQLLSKRYTQESWKKWRKNIQPLEIWKSDEKSDEKRSLIFPDGSVEYGRAVYKSDSDKEARQYIRGKVYHLEEYKTLDVMLQTEFSAFVKSIQQQGIEVVFFFPPYHPIVYEYFCQNDKYACVLQAEDWFRSFARDNLIEVIGSYNPAEMGLGSEDFFDGMHLKRYVLEKSD